MVQLFNPSTVKDACNIQNRYPLPLGQPKQGRLIMNIVPFSFETYEVRVIIIDGEPWFVAADICRVLGLVGSVSQNVAKLKANEKDVKEIDTPGGKQKMLVVNEKGLYRLIFRSNKPEAERFQDWVFGDVLPSIRKSGGYGTPQPAQSSSPSVQEIAETTTAILSIAGLQPYLIAGAVANAIAKQYPERKQIAEEAKKFLPLPVKDELLTVTNLAKKYVEVTGKQLSKNNTDHGNAIEMNTLLLERGLQTKNPNKKAKKDGQPAYLPTELGKQYGEIVLQEATASNKTVQQLRWYPSVIDFLG